MAKILTKLNMGDTVASSGTRVFKKLTTADPVLPMPTEPGLYDANDNLVASWDALVNTYGLDVEKNYTGDTSETDPAHFLYITTNNSELSAGVKLIIPDTVERIGKYAFWMCSSPLSGEGLRTVVLNDGITSIANSAFGWCLYLTNIAIPVSVTTIEPYAFYRCDNLADVYYKGTEEQWAAITISEGNALLKNATIHYNYTG